MVKSINKKKILLAFVDQGVYSAFSFGVIVVLARTQSYSALSLYNEFMILATFFLMLNNSAAVTLLNSLGGNKRFGIESGEIEKTTIAITSIIAISSFVASLIIFGSLDYSYISLAFLTTGLVVRDYCRKYLFFKDNLDSIAKNLLLSFILYLIATLLFFLKAINGIFFFILALLPACLVSLFYFLRVYDAKIQDRVNFKGHVGFYGWQVLSGLLLWGGLNFYLILAAWYLDDEQNSYIRGLFSIGSIFGMLILSLESFLPKLLNDTKQYALGAKSYVPLSCLLLAAGLLIYLFRNFIITFIFGSAAVVYAPALLLVVVWQIIGLLSYLIHIGLRRGGNTKVISIAYMAFLACTLTIGPSLVKTWEVMGVFVGIVTSQTIYFAVLVVAYIKKRRNEKYIHN